MFYIILLGIRMYNTMFTRLRTPQSGPWSSWAHQTEKVRPVFVSSFFSKLIAVLWLPLLFIPWKGIINENLHLQAGSICFYFLSSNKYPPILTGPLRCGQMGRGSSASYTLFSKCPEISWHRGIPWVPNKDNSKLLQFLPGTFTD